MAPNSPLFISHYFTNNHNDNSNGNINNDNDSNNNNHNDSDNVNNDVELGQVKNRPK